MSKTDPALALSPVKGRPMLNWVGKRALSRVTAFAAQQSEVFDPRQTLAGTTPPAGWPAAFPPAGLLFHGDNKEVLATLLTNGLRGKINLIYIDPPFDSGADYVRKVQLRGKTDAGALAAAGYSVGEQVQYTDIWANDNYLQFMYERLILLKELLADNGSIYLHCDWHKSYYLRCLLDEVFEADNFVNEIVWAYRSGGASRTESLPRKHDVILWYKKGGDCTVNSQTERQYLEKAFMGSSQDEDGRFYVDTILRDVVEGLVKVVTKSGKIREYNVRPVLNLSSERTDYPTQKPEGLLELLIEIASNPGDIVLDCFLGSGTTAAVAQRLGRRWIGADINKGAIQTASRRLQEIIVAQAGGNGKAKQNGLQGMEHDAAPAQTAFAVYRVNDYDLAVQHNEMVALACEQIGVVRSKTDDYFDGTLGSGTTQELVKIVPFQHPASRSDLEEIISKLGERPDETRGILLVAVGKELTVDSWLDEWNHRRGVTRRDEAGRPVEFVNKIRLIDLRTDAKYGRFLIHQAASAELTVTRAGDQIQIRIDSFLSPTIIERLGIDTADNPLFRVRIPDWRAMVNAVEIDSAYDGAVFHITHSDIPAKKTDLVNGTYQLTAPADPTTVAVKITDMLGEEVLLIRQV
ncbi:MAG: site-specific DNA-methyltransferase [Chloroflexota bacterium]|nr:site-specific DNA-methyltransferase [Chloroflexota bacterium]